MKRKYIRLEVTDSTNNYAKQMPIDITATEEMTIITARVPQGNMHGAHVAHILERAVVARCGILFGQFK